MRRQRGQALVLVLILLGLMGLLLVSVLSYSGTALRFYGISRTFMWTTYAVEGTVSEALWKLQYDLNFADQVAAAGESGVSWSNTLNQQDVTITVSVPGALTAPPEPTPTPTADPCLYAWVTRDTNLTQPGDQTWAQVGQPIEYTVTLLNCSTSTSTKNIRQVRVLLPNQMAYITDTTTGTVTILNPQQATCTGADTPYGACEANSVLLVWPAFNDIFSGGTAVTVKGGESRVLKFRVMASDYGVFFIDVTACFFAADAGKCETEAIGDPLKKVAPVAVGLFNISAQGKGYGVRAGTGKGSGPVQVLSWQNQ